jgi:rubrerythrin
MDTARPDAPVTEEHRKLAYEFDNWLDPETVAQSLANYARDQREHLLRTVRKHYPSIAGRAIQLRQSGEMNAAKEWEEISHDFSDLMDGSSAQYVRWQDDVWSCSTCGNDVTNLYPDSVTCPNCSAALSAPAEPAKEDR